MKTLTKAEAYLFSLTGSQAKTLSAQRAAIARCGLTGMTPATVRRARQKAFAEWRSTQSDLAGMPAWLAAARWESLGSDWLHAYAGDAGQCLDVPLLSRIAHYSVDWGRLRKHSGGNATAFAPRVREETNGKTGWDCVTWRHADYLSVLSPDGHTIAIQTDSSPIELHSVYRNQCLYRGERVYLKLRDAYRPYRVTLRDTCRLLRRHGYDSRMVHQSADMVSAGSGDSTRDRSHQLYCVIPDGIGGWYHVTAGQSVESIRATLANRRQTQQAAEIDAAVDRVADRLWVCVDDSLSSGNCYPGTNQFRQSIQSVLSADGELGAVTAATILSLRDDQFTRRACRAAYVRQYR